MTRCMTGCILATFFVTVLAPLRAQTAWSEFAPKDAGFAVQLPGAPERNDNGQYTAQLGEMVFMVQADPVHPGILLIVESADRTKITAMLEGTRDLAVKEINGTLRSSSIGEVDGHPSILFSFDMRIDDKPFVGTERIAVTDQYMYVLVAIGPQGAAADSRRFHESFRLVAPSPAATALRTISFSDAVCSRIPALPITFEMPADFVPRAVGGIEGGCVWGAKDDLDRVTVDPTQGDFTALRRGVFRARVTSEVVCSPETGVFDQTDGMGEEGMRQNLEAAGAKIIIWKKETIAGLPALQIVADAFGSRVYMLYLGNTKFTSNAMLVNYYRPTKRSAADDQLWAQFVAGIKAAK